ncbi:MAG: endonuclease/exonuclease/phosphatase family protein [Candidatus Omnitrophica bacterium]|nr:endonuclease/exonuclease/phosphatase family protein [Candidatus Omnitrophota bacterium]
MKILTLNTWQELGAPWKDRWEVTFEGVGRLCPQIAAFQELFNRSWAETVQKRAGFSTLIFPEENCGLALYANYPAASWGMVQLTQSPLEEYFRGVLWAELKVAGEALYFFNTHLSWKLEDGATRRKQVQEVLQLIEEKSAGKEAVLVGDLNAPPDSEEIQTLIREGGFRDTFRLCHPGEAGFSWDNRNPYAGGSLHKMPDRRIDYILARGAGPLLKNLKSSGLIFTAPGSKGFWASDHFGLLAEFQ